VKKLKKKGYLTADKFKKFVDENSVIKKIELSNQGEVFLNPDLYEIIRYAYEKGISVSVNNGANLNNVEDRVFEALVKYKVRSIICAIDGAAAETYKKYRAGGDFDAVIDNIKRINFYKSKYHSKYPLLHWQYIVFGHNELEIPQAKKMARELRMSFKPIIPWDSTISPVNNKEFVKRETGLEFKGINDDIENQETSYHLFILCTQLWNYPQIQWNGDMLGCCCNDRGNFGNVFEQSFLDVLNNESMNYARGMLRGVVAGREDIPCSTCVFYQIMKENRKWISSSQIRLAKYRQKFIEIFFKLAPEAVIYKIMAFLYSKRV